MPKQPAGMITGKIVNHKVFETLVSRAASFNSKMATTRGEMGALMKDAEETHGVHRGAFKLALKLNGMEDLKMKDFLRSFDIYREYLKLDTRGTSDMLENEGDEAEEGGDDHHDDGEAGTSDEEWQASAPPATENDDEALAPGVVKVGGEVVKLGPKLRAGKTEPDGTTTDPQEMGRRLAGDPLDELTGGRRH